MGAQHNVQHPLDLEVPLARPPISFLDQWQVLGPFQIGTRGMGSSWHRAIVC